MSSALALGYLDDISLRGASTVVAEGVKHVEDECGLMRLQLNPENREEWIYHLVLQRFIPLATENACLSGAPRSPEKALTTWLELRCSELAVAVSRLENMSKR